MRFEIEKDFTFEAAHYFGHADANDVFKKIHGHSFKFGAACVRTHCGLDF